MEVVEEYLTGAVVISEEVLAEGMEEAMVEETGVDAAGVVAVVDRCNEFRIRLSTEQIFSKPI